ncbi:MAG TPA: hypothetical protein VFN36_04750 [Solirubrobacteraceae bacterium]|nr:hypothetical protein [Solirubrobacteraceae bacterium]
MLRRLCGPTFVVAGLLHFLKPRFYRRIVPPYLPAPGALVFLSGVAEVGGGVGLMLPALRSRARWWLVATLLAVFPANVHMARHPEDFPRVPGGSRALRWRLPLQGLFLAWVLAAGRPPGSPEGEAAQDA